MTAKELKTGTRAMKRYLGDKYREIHGSLREEWYNSWTLHDESMNSPRQTNGYDCGVVCDG